ncbi:hypothetical protein Acr_00g0017410 [Actinidia rufa]|uniref:Uncharacterized protein n=1 Tax=Actinidia rufa TaxID=165716 RepID=A0A7J0DB72_9ERIC|nr:hypothetical protein Acr_00g0017410 [Actinidia rufa]
MEGVDEGSGRGSLGCLGAWSLEFDVLFGVLKGLVFWVFGPVILGEGCLGGVDSEVFYDDDDGGDDDKGGFGSKCSGGVGGDNSPRDAPEDIVLVFGFVLHVLRGCIGNLRFDEKVAFGYSN